MESANVGIVEIALEAGQRGANKVKAGHMPLVFSESHRL